MFALWRGEPLEVVSPMSYLQAYERLRVGLLAGETTPGEDGYRVVGTMGNRWIRMEAVPSGVRNAFRPVAESSPPGSSRTRW